MTADLISISEFAQIYENSGVRAVDCRFDLFDADKGEQDYQAAHIPGAVYAHMDNDLASPITPETGRHPLPDPDDFRAALENWGISDDTTVVAYDYGNSSLAVRLWWMLKFWLGHESVAVLNGGMAGWNSAGLPVERGSTSPGRGQYRRLPDDSVVATTMEIEAALSSGAPLALIDARDAARFAGEMEPIDAVAGHIPGAINMPLAGNLDAEGLWRSPEALQDRWRALAVSPESDDVVVMCGSGVTACHLILSSVVAGLPAPRLYVGSWSEWIRDPGRPIEGSKRG